MIESLPNGRKFYFKEFYNIVEAKFAGKLFPNVPNHDFTDFFRLFYIGPFFDTDFFTCYSLVKFYKTTFVGCANIGLHMKFGGLSVTSKKVMSHRTLHHHNTRSKQSVITFLFVTESPPNFICKPIFAHQTNVVL